MNRSGYYTAREGLWAFLGNYGSGKTEIAVNYAISGAFNGTAPVSIIDLDIINPYFRSREVEDILQKYDINVISPKGELKYADLPIILPNVKSSIKDFKGLLVLDIGGEDTGANIIRPFKHFLEKDNSNICMVINMKRPFTSDEKSILETKRRIEEKSELRIDFFINNTNLIEQTDAEIITKSHKTIKKAAEAAKTQFLFTAVMKEHVSAINSSIEPNELFVLERFMLPPWYSDIQRFKPLKDRRSFII